MGYFSKIRILFLILFLINLNKIEATEIHDRSKIEELEPVYVISKKINAEQQTIPGSITVLKDIDIKNKNIGNIYESILSFPNFYMIKAGNGSAAGFVTMRGVAPGMEGDQVVGFFIDDVYSKNFDSSLLDIERIEVLHGAQSTLYGRNTEVGAVIIKTKDPEFSPEYKFDLSYSRFNQLSATAILNNSITRNNQLAYRLAIKYLSSDGYFENSDNKKKDIDRIREFDGRVKLRWLPLNGYWNIISTLDFKKNKNGNTSFAPLDMAMQGSNHVDSDYIGKIDNTTYKTQIKAIRNFANTEFTSISAYSKEKQIDNQDLDFTSFPIMNLLMNFKNQQFSQEFRLNSKNNEKFKWVIGASYLHTKDNSIIDMIYLPFNVSSYRDSTIKTNDYALFANMSYYLTDKYELFIGSRYDYEKKYLVYKIHDQIAGLSPQNLQNNKSFKSFLPKIGVNYHFNKNTILYGSIYRGYKSGGFNVLNSLNNRSFNSEYSTNYEIGLKTELNKKVRWNTSLFWINLTDQQVEITNYPVSYTVNSGKSVSKGLETEFLWKVTPSFTTSFNIGYTDARYKEFPTKIKVAPNQFKDVNYKNNRPANVPMYTYNLALNYDFDNGYFLHADYHVKGKSFFDNANTRKHSSFGLLDLTAGYNTHNYSVKLWAKNALNKKYVTRAFQMDNGVWYARRGKPVSLGISANFKF